MLSVLGGEARQVTVHEFSSAMTNMINHVMRHYSVYQHVLCSGPGFHPGLVLVPYVTEVIVQRKYSHGPSSFSNVATATAGMRTPPNSR